MLRYEGIAAYFDADNLQVWTISIHVFTSTLLMYLMTDHFNGEAFGRHYELMLYPLGTERRDDG